MGRKKTGKGFGGSAPGHFSLHPYSLDTAVLQLSRIGAVKVTPSVSPDELPDGTLVWEYIPAYHYAGIQAIGEDWLIELTICDCCPGIKAWEIKVTSQTFDHQRQGTYIHNGMELWEGAEQAVKAARIFAKTLAEMKQSIQRGNS